MFINCFANFFGVNTPKYGQFHVVITSLNALLGRFTDDRLSQASAGQPQLIVVHLQCSDASK